MMVVMMVAISAMSITMIFAMTLIAAAMTLISTAMSAMVFEMVMVIANYSIRNSSVVRMPPRSML